MRSPLHPMARAATPTGLVPREQEPHVGPACGDCGSFPCECPEPDEAGFADDDLTSADHRHWYEAGTGQLKLHLSGDQLDHLEWYLHDWCAEQGCFPNFWFVSDHGNPVQVVPEPAPDEEPKCPQGHYGPWEFRFRSWRRARLKEGSHGFKWEVDYQSTYDDDDGSVDLENRLVCVCDEATEHGYPRVCNQEIDLDEPRALYEAGVRDLDNFLMY
jgi:hypothetical protein